MELAILREGTLALPSWMLFHLGKKILSFLNCVVSPDHPWGMMVHMGYI
jgi:hypothetical protein